MPFNFGEPQFFQELVLRFSASSSKSNSKVHVLLHSTNGNDSDDPGAESPEKPFEVADRLWLCRLPTVLRDIVYKVCEPSIEPHEEIFRQYGQLYTAAFFLGPTLPGTLGGWDGYGVLSKFVTFSQLMLSTSIGFGSTAILTFGPEGQFLKAEPGPCRGITEHAVVVPNTRNWLSVAECQSLRDFFNNTDLSSLPDRVARAHWALQHAAYQYYFEVKLMLVASGLDALVHIRTPGKRLSTGAQFKGRSVLLAKELGVSFSNDEARVVWDHRSDISHGRDPWEVLRNTGTMPSVLTKDQPLVQLLMKCEQILRFTVLRCLRDPLFASKFQSDASVEVAYPLSLARVPYQ